MESDHFNNFSLDNTVSRSFFLRSIYENFLILYQIFETIIINLSPERDRFLDL